MRTPPLAVRTLLCMAALGAPAGPVRRTECTTTLAQPQPGHEHLWRVRGLTPEYFTTAAPGTLRDSASFTAVGYTWRLQLAPNGSTKKLHGGVGVYLKLTTAERTTPMVNFTLRVRTHAFCCDQRFNTCTDAGDRLASWGDTCLIPHSELLTAFDAFAPGGVMEVRLRLRMSDDDDASPESCEWGVCKAPSLADDMCMLLASGAGADVTLVCSGGEQLRAHGALLSVRSPVFAAQLRGGPRKKVDTSAVPVPPDVTAHALRQLLQFLYTDDLLEPPSPEEAPDLFRAAAYYNVPRLFDVCERALREALSVDNAADTLLLADTHGARRLKNSVLRFVAANALAVMATPGWAHLFSVRPPLVLEAMHTLAAGEPPAPAQGAGTGGDAGEDSAERRVRQRVR